MQVLSLRKLGEIQTSGIFERLLKNIIILVVYILGVSLIINNSVHSRLLDI